MLNKDTLISVTNRDNGTVGYSVQDLNIRRDFMPRETKEVTMEELRRLSYQPGGKNLIKGFFIIDNEGAIKELLGEVEPEYFYTESDIKNLLLKGTIEQLMDCLDFAPSGVIDLVKSLAVDLKLNDLNKRDIILQKTGFNVTNAIRVNEESNENNESQSEEKTGRRANPINKETIERKTKKPKTYKVVTKD